jgi:hypothetical protein
MRIDTTGRSRPSSGVAGYLRTSRKARKVTGVLSPKTDHVYVEIPPEEVPKGVAWDVPTHGQGHPIEIAWGGYGAIQHGPGSLYKRVVDKVVPAGDLATVEFYRLEVPASEDERRDLEPPEPAEEGGTCRECEGGCPSWQTLCDRCQMLIAEEA